MYIMRKFFLLVLGIGGMIALLTMPASATTTISLSPSLINVSRGQSFDLLLTMNSQGIRVYTLKVELSYPPNLIEVGSFRFGDNWLSLPQPGYDSIDNTNGKLVKTAGYPKGIANPVVFGTVSFTAKQSGNAVISTGSNSLALDAQNNNIFAAPLAQALVTIIEPAPSLKPSVPPPVPSEEAAPLRTQPAITPSPPLPTPQEEVPLPAPAPSFRRLLEPTSLLALVRNLFTLKNYAFLVTVLLAICLGVLLVIRLRNKK